MDLKWSQNGANMESREQFWVDFCIDFDGGANMAPQGQFWIIVDRFVGELVLHFSHSRAQQAKKIHPWPGGMRGAIE